jgi:hypothetical protein
MTWRLGIVLGVTLAVSNVGWGSFTVHYTVDAGGTNENPLNGMSAAATFDLVGTQLTILMENTSTGVPVGALAADSLLASLGFNLVDDVHIVSGDSALIGPGSYGVGSWDGLFEGDDVGDEWLWTNDFGGDGLSTYAQIISTSQGQGGGSTWSFNGEPDPVVSGPFGGMAADPPLIEILIDQPAVSDSIRFTLTLSGSLSDAQLEAIANDSMVEFGSDYQYLAVPSPAALPALLVAVIFPRRRR